MRILQYTIIAALLLCLCLGARAVNTVSLSSVSGAPGTEVKVAVSLTNTEAVSALQFSIPLGEYLSYVDGSVKAADRLNGHQLSAVQKDGRLNIMVYSLAMDAVSGSAGELLTFRLALGNAPVDVELAVEDLVLTSMGGSKLRGETESGSVSIRCAKAQYNTTDIDFGRVPINGSYHQTLTVTNVGNEPLTVTGVVFMDGTFSTITPLPMEIAAGSSQDIEVRYNPVARGVVNSQVTIVCNSISKLNTIRLQAQPFAVNELHVKDVAGVSDEEVTVVLTMNNMDDICGMQVSFRLPDELGYVDGSFELSERKQDHVASASLHDGMLRLIGFSTSGKAFTGNDGEVGRFKVRIVGRNSTVLKADEAILTGIIDGKTENVLSDDYGGQISISSPLLNASDVLDFGDMPVTGDISHFFKVNNYGSAPLILSRIVFDCASFRVQEQFPLQVEPSQSKTITVVNTDKTEGNFSATMQVYSNDPERRLHSVAVSGRVFAPNYLNADVMEAYTDYVALRLSMDNYDVIEGIQFDLTAAEGYELANAGVQLLQRGQGLVVTTQRTNDKTWHVVAFATGDGIPKGEGELMTIALKPEKNLVVGTHDLIVSNVILGVKGMKDKYEGSATQSITFSVATPKPAEGEQYITVTAASYTRVYGDPNPAFSYSVSGGELTGLPELECWATAVSPVGSYPIVVKKGSIANGQTAFVNGTMTIVPAPLTVMVGDYTRKRGEVNPDFVISYEGFKNGENSSDLTVRPIATTTAVRESVVGEYAITVNGAVADNYAISYVPGKLTVIEADPVKVTAKSYTRVYGEENPTFGYDVEGAALDGQPEISCEATATSPVGTYPIMIKKGGVKNYNDTYVNGTLTITKAPLTVTAGSYIRKQGEANPTFAVSYEGYVNNETETVLTALPVVSCEATEASAPGVYDIVVSGGEAENYEFKYVAGKLTVTEADAVKVTAKSYTRVYGEENPAFEYDVEGVALDGQPEISCEATATSPVGTYPIIIKKGGVKNYNDTYVNGTLTITKALLTVTAGSYTRKQGEANPTFAVCYEGFVNNETETVLMALPVVSCEATEASAPGVYDIVVSGGEAENYEFKYVAGKLTVTEADAVKVTAKSYTRVYGVENPAFEYEVEGVALDGQPEISCEATVTSPVGTYPIIIKKGGVKNYNDTYVNGTLTITKAPLTVTAGSYARKQGETNPTFAVSYEGYVNNETETVLTALPVVSCEATEASAPGVYDIVVSGGEAENYEFKYVAGKLTVTEADAVKVTAKSYTRVYGEENPAFEYDVEGAALDGKPEISCDATAASSVGTYPIMIKKGGVSNFNDTYIDGVLTVTKAPLTVTAQSYTRKQGEANPTFAVSYEGFVNNETETVLTALPVVSCEATEASAPGVYDIVVSGGEAQNYELTYVAGKLTVTEADAVRVTAKSYTRVYGVENPAFEYDVEGVALDGQPEISCEATATSPVGTYPIMIKKGGVKNYNDTYVNGTLTITKAPLTVTAGSYTRKQGEANPTFAVSYEGFVNNETETVLTALPVVSCEATEASAPGVYDIVVSGGEAQNYELTYVAGKLTVTEADAVKVTAKSYTRFYGDENPTFEYDVEGAALYGMPEISCVATEASPVGTYPIVITKGSVKNYNDTYVNGVLTVTKAPLTITVGSYTKKQYDAMPEFAVSYEGFVNGETEAVLTKLPTVSCEADKDSKPGEYVITLSGAEAENYAMQYVAGKLTVLEPDDINNAAQQVPYIVRICSVGGKPRKELQKGVNIVVMSDGTTRKVVIK